ncbi:hypothetical protein BZM27_55555, partial [Paraburkholderia steynii]
VALHPPGPLREVISHSFLSQFVKFFLVPGAAHGEGGQFKGSYDGLTVLDNWVTSGKEPKNLTITDLNASTYGRTRPLCEYPQSAEGFLVGDRGYVPVSKIR